MYGEVENALVDAGLLNKQLYSFQKLSPNSDSISIFAYLGFRVAWLV